MHVEHSHQLTETEAIRRIDDRLNSLLQQQPPAGITVSRADKHWQGNRMNFALTAGRGFMNSTVTGSVLVTGDRVVIESQVPGIIRTLVGETRIERELHRELDRLLTP